jgi:hypothetical protein
MFAYQLLRYFYIVNIFACSHYAILINNRTCTVYGRLFSLSIDELSTIIEHAVEFWVVMSILLSVLMLSILL